MNNDFEKQVTDRYLWNAFKNTQKNRAWWYPNLETVFITECGGSNYDDDERTYHINLDSYFKYLEYKDLKYAIKSSEKAQKNAVIAIVFSFVAILVTVVVWFVQINTPIVLDENQFSKIVDWLANQAHNLEQN